MPASTVAGVLRSFSRRRRKVRPRTISPIAALYSAAGTPLPDTSPTATTSVLGSGDRKSHRSPPSSRAGSKCHATSTPRRRFGSSCGSSAICTRCAKRSSFSNRASLARIDS